MDDIIITKSDGKVCISSNKLSVADFGENLYDAKVHFKQAINMMLDTKLNAFRFSSITARKTLEELKDVIRENDEVVTK